MSKPQFMDWSTIDIGKLKKLPVAKIAPTYTISDSYGSGCAGDPPGYPSYFVRHIYTQFGNSPRKGATAVITVPGYGARILETADESYEQLKAVLRSLWLPLPWEHARTQAWIRATCSHQGHCFWDDEGRLDKDRMLIWPWEEFWTTKYCGVKPAEIDDARFKDTVRDLARRSYQAKVGALKEAATEIAILKNALAYRSIAKYYPKEVMLLDPECVLNPLEYRDGNWWEYMATKPTPDKCPGECGWGKGTGTGTDHPVNGDWCQVCGWHKEKDAL